ncbi:MAG: AAA family ATPase [Sandaracinaceae bacterium]|nr:AAA family ATPase [Sandaracinaceae bacterium]
MRLIALELRNIGPFDEATLDLRPEGEEEPVPVTLITGENGTGKTLLLDVVRTMFGERYHGKVIRPVARPNQPGSVEVWLSPGRHKTRSPQLRPYAAVANRPNAEAPHVRGERSGHGADWVVDYWASAASPRPFEISSLDRFPLWNFLHGAFSGLVENPETTQFICQVDYLRDSRDPAEREAGEALWAAVQRVAEVSLINGRLDRVMRATLKPIFVQHGRELELRHLNSGSLYLMQHAMALLRRMYGCFASSPGTFSRILDVPGLLLIDEAENHLHPKWQKTLIPVLREIFPHVQIVATTHSPFVVASAPAGSKVFVCEQDGAERCVVRDVSADYGHLPIGEVLASPAFSGTLPFSEEVTQLVEARRRAIDEGDEARRAQLEAQLQRLNPDEFGYLSLPDDLRRLLEPTGT